MLMPRFMRPIYRPSQVLGPKLISGEYVIAETNHGLLPLLLTRGSVALARNSDLEALQRTARCIADRELVWTAVAEARSA